MTPSVAAPHPAASVDAAGWGWRHAGRTTWAVHDLTLHIEAGERVLLLGPSGSGKSTLLGALAGILGGADEGEERGRLLVGGREAAHTRGTAGLVLQDPDSQTVMARVGDDVAFSCENLGVPRDETWRRVGEALDAVGLPLPLDHPTKALSGGQRQRLAIAGVLAMQPGLLLLDEPTANLDPVGVDEVRQAVENVLRGTGATLVVVEHRVEVWEDLVDRVAVLDRDGALVADGSPHQVLRDHRDALMGQGIWVPGYRAVRRRPPPGRQREPLVHTEELSITRASTRWTRGGVDLRLHAGELTAITGPNGCGKSTLGLTLGGLLAPMSGRVVATALQGEARTPHPIEWTSRQLVTRIGSVLQDPDHQFVTGSVLQELHAGPRAAGLSPDLASQRVEEVLERLRLGHLAGANPYTLSGGEKRRLSVATVLTTRPSVLVLDEPTFGQDLRTWEELVTLLAELLDDGAGIAAATHDGHFVDALADRQYAFHAWEHRPGVLEEVG